MAANLILHYLRLAASGGRRSSRDVENPVAVRLADETDFKHTGRMDFVDNAINPKTGTICGRAIFDNKDGLLTPGFFGRLRLYGGNSEAFLISDSAIVSDQASKIVFAVAEDGTVGVKKDVRDERLADGRNGGAARSGRGGYLGGVSRHHQAAVPASCRRRHGTLLGDADGRRCARRAGRARPLRLAPTASRSTAPTATSFEQFFAPERQHAHRPIWRLDRKPHPLRDRSRQGNRRGNRRRPDGHPPVSRITPRVINSGFLNCNWDSCPVISSMES